MTSQADLVIAATRLGYFEYSDLQDPTRFNSGIERALRYITTDGQRHETAHAYPNLRILCQSEVNRVLLDENIPAGRVKCASNPLFDLNQVQRKG